MKKEEEKSILFLCDDHTLCESVTLFLSAWYKASCAKSFEGVESHLRKQIVNLLLVDVGLDREVVQRIQRIKEANPMISIVVMAVYQPATAHLEVQLRPFVDAWFHKPFDLDELRGSVENLLGPEMSGH